MELQEFIQTAIYVFGLGYLYGRWPIISTIGLLILVLIPVFDEKSSMHDPKTSEVLQTPMFWLMLMICFIFCVLGVYQGYQHKKIIQNQ